MRPWMERVSEVTGETDPDLLMKIGEKVIQDHRLGSGLDHAEIEAAGIHWQGTLDRWVDRWNPIVIESMIKSAVATI